MRKMRKLSPKSSLWAFGVMSLVFLVFVTAMVSAPMWGMALMDSLK
jgi:hypothetical protein